MNTRHTRRTRPLHGWAHLSVVAAAAALVVACGGGSDGDPACTFIANDTSEKLTDCVTLGGVRDQQRELQRIADDNDGTRASGTPGYDASADYVASTLEDAGYRVTRQEFDFTVFSEDAETVLRQVTPAPAAAIDNLVMEYSGSGSVEGEVAQPSDADRLGCTPADFAGFPAGTIALISRGSCAFADKASNAAAAGAIGVVIYNNEAGPLNGTLGETFALDIPVTGIEQARGEELAALDGLTLALSAETTRTTSTTSNVLAELPGDNEDSVVMVGAHLDSVAEGPGINDNGSGVAAILETALKMKNVTPRNTVRFAFWGAEEANLVGSTYYVGNLSEAELGRITAYLNFDMVGSPNPVYFIYDGDDSDAVGEGPGPTGSADIEATFEEFYDSRGLPFKGTDFDGRSDYGPFIAAGVAAGGLFTGAEDIKTEEEARIFGGTAGEAYDKCYHQACDTFDNVDLDALDVNADAIAHATITYAMSDAVAERALSAREKPQGLRAGWKPQGKHLPKPTE